MLLTILLSMFVIVEQATFKICLLLLAAEKITTCCWEVCHQSRTWVSSRNVVLDLLHLQHIPYWLYEHSWGIKLYMDFSIYNKMRAFPLALKFQDIFLTFNNEAARTAENWIPSNGVHLQFERPRYHEKIVSITFQERVIWFLFHLKWRKHLWGFYHLEIH